MTNLLLAATSLTAVPSSAAPLEGASRPAQDFAGQTAFEPIAARIPPHTPEWTNLNQSDPGVTSMEAFAWLGEAEAYRLVASASGPDGTALRHDSEWKYVNVRRFYGP